MGETTENLLNRTSMIFSKDIVDIVNTRGLLDEIIKHRSEIERLNREVSNRQKVDHFKLVIKWAVIQAIAWVLTLAASLFCIFQYLN